MHMSKECDDSELNRILGRSELLAILNILKEGVVTIDNQKRIAYLNEEAARLYDIEIGKAIGNDVSILKTWEAVASIKQKYERNDPIIDPPGHSVTLLTRRNGDECWVDKTLFPLLDEQHRQKGFILLSLDVTEQRELQEESKYLLALRTEAEREIRNTRIEIQKFLDAVSEPFFLLDSNLKIIYANIGTEKAFGKSSEQLAGLPIEKIAPHMIETELYRHLAAGETNLSFREFFKPLGIWIDCAIYSLGMPLDMNVGVHLRDVSESIALEKKLAESKVSYEQLINSIQEPFFALDKRFRVTYWNGEMEKLTNVSAHHALDKHIRMVFPHGSEKSHREVYFSVLREGKPKCITINLEIKNEEHTFETYIYPSATGLSVLLKDVTESRKLEAELKNYNEHLQQLVEERTKALRDAEHLAGIGQTAGMVGHDIRNPLQSILSELYLAKGEVTSIAQNDIKRNLKESIVYMENDIQYIDKIVQDLTDYARQLKPAIREVNTKELIDDALKKSGLPIDNIKTSVIIEENARRIISDPDMLKRILTNLATNAVQAMPQGGTLTVRAQKEPDGGTRISVGDTGLGISPEAQTKVFTPLFTTKSKGQGFGLPVVKRLTEALGGAVTFKTEAGKGTEFTVTLPNNEKQQKT